MDGAGRWRRMWHVTLPALRPVIALLLVLRVGDALTVGFEQILLQRDAVGRGASEVLDTYVWNVGIQNGDFSYAAAVGLIKGDRRHLSGPRCEQGRPSARRAGGVQEVSLNDAADPQLARRRLAPGVGGGAEQGRTHRQGRLSSSCAASAVLAPLWIVIVTSLSPKPVIDRAGGLVVVPEGITFVNYKELLSGGQVSRAAHGVARRHPRRHAVLDDGVGPRAPTVCRGRGASGTGSS